MREKKGEGMNRWGFAIAVTLVACGGGPAVSSWRVRGPDGKNNWVAITCRGLQMRCIQRAGEACPGGYHVDDERGHEEQESSGFASFNGGYAVSRSARTYHGELLVQCKGAPAAAADDASDHRECLGDASCDTGDYCAFAPHSGPFDKGHCQPRGN